MTPELIFYAGSTLLEGPTWDHKEKVLYCVSIQQCLIYRIDISKGEVTSYPTNGEVGCVQVDADGMLWSAEKNGIYKINPRTKERFFIKQLENDKSMRYNDGILDAEGRLLVGTMGYNETRQDKGKLYSFDGIESKAIVTGTTISNGLGFSKNGEFLYFIDTPTKKVARYTYDLKSGNASFERIVINIPGNGSPDGMCVDLDDMIWVAEWEGGRVCKWNPETGEKILEIIMPCNRVTSCCVGGDNLNYLFVTTAKDELSDEMAGGGLFKVKIR